LRSTDVSVDFKLAVIFRKGKVNQFQAHKAQVNCVTADATKIVSASYDGTIKVWDFRDQEY